MSNQHRRILQPLSDSPSSQGMWRTPNKVITSAEQPAEPPKLERPTRRLVWNHSEPLAGAPLLPTSPDGLNPILRLVPRPVSTPSALWPAKGLSFPLLTPAKGYNNLRGKNHPPPPRMDDAEMAFVFDNDDTEEEWPLPLLPHDNDESFCPPVIKTSSPLLRKQFAPFTQ